MIQPLFGAAHMRALTPTFWGVACQARDVIGAKVCAARASDVGKASQQISTASQQPSAVLDLWKWCSRAALEGVGVGALGYSFDALDDETEDNAYMVAAHELPCVRPFLPSSSAYSPPPPLLCRLFHFFGTDTPQLHRLPPAQVHAHLHLVHAHPARVAPTRPRAPHTGPARAKGAAHRRDTAAE